MKKLIKNSINRLGLLVLLTASICWTGCEMFASHSDPLVGFHAGDFRTLDANKTITDDYKNYIEKLSLEEKKYLGPSPTDFFEDGTGQHAVRITIGLNGTVWRHILIYDKNDKRIKTIKYASGDYHS